MELVKTTEKVRKLLAKNKMVSVFELCAKILNNHELQNELILQEARFNKIEQQNRIGIVGLDDYNLICNQIRYGILELISNIEKINHPIFLKNLRNPTPEVVFKKFKYNVEEIRKLDSILFGDNELPRGIKENLTLDNIEMVKNLQQSLEKNGIKIKSHPLSIIEQYGLLADPLRKMCTNIGSEVTLRGFSFMVGAYLNSIRFLCYTQLSQILIINQDLNNDTINKFLNLNSYNNNHFDFLSLLVETTEILKGNNSFMPEIEKLVDELFSKNKDLLNVLLILDKHKNYFLNNEIDSDKIEILTSEYRTALQFWLQRISFLSNYKLLSIHDIKVTRKYKADSFFELIISDFCKFFGNDFEKVILPYSYEGVNLLSKSIIIIKDIESSYLDNLENPNLILSLSPFVIDSSAYSNKQVQTSEIYYYEGKRKNNTDFQYAKINNEIPFQNNEKIVSNRHLVIDKKNHEFENVFEEVKILLRK